MRSLQQLLPTCALRELIRQKPFIRRILQKPPDQIRHARQQLPDRTVLAQPATQLHHGGLDRVRHPVKHLKLEIAPVNTKPLGLRQRVSDAADVVRAECRIHRVIVLQQRQ